MIDNHNLCQPHEFISCGACCGLYNYADGAKASLVRRLRKRTALYEEFKKSLSPLEEFAAAVKSIEDGGKIYEDIYCCEFLGFLDEDEKRVGCLIHPAQNEGRNLRHLSFYGQELCDGHRCPSWHFLSENEKEALIHIFDDWYLYGLVLVDLDLVKQYFYWLQIDLHETPPAGLFTIPLYRKLALDFFSLKLNWPFRSGEINVKGRYYFDGYQGRVRLIDYERMGAETSPFHKIFISLLSFFRNRNELREAERIIGQHFSNFVAVYRSEKSF